MDWYPWGDEALETARSANKIILVSIGYSACHWCHVMERESFEDRTVASLMNAHFINIKIDREERPDLDHIYMDAVQAMTGSGGWPLNVFLTPDAKPFYGGTYFPPVRAHNRPSWTEVLNNVQAAWKSKGAEIQTQAATLTEHLQRSNDLSNINKTAGAGFFSSEDCDTIFQNIMASADKDWGGFGNAPKFPQTFTIQYLLQYHFYTGNKEAKQHALLSIDKMLEGGIYDHVGGGFARYSTDREWLAPHFEKMLYDNALLVNILCDAYLVTRDPLYEKAIRETIGFVTRELMSEEGGFYAALDADSEGEEGKYYVWKKSEIELLLGDDAPLFCAYYDISEKGNWSEPGHPGGRNILRTLKKAVSFTAERGIDPEAFKINNAACLGILMEERNKRIRPLLDDKILLNWNALMLTALCKAAGALNDAQYSDLAIKNFRFLQENLGTNDAPEFRHTWKNKIAKYPAFLDDYACMIQAAICLQELCSDQQYLLAAERMSDYVLTHFTDEGTGFFFFTNSMQKDVIIRKKEIYDGATASGNSIMAENLFYLSVILDKPEWQKHAEKISGTVSAAVTRYATSFAVWASVLMRQVYGVQEIVITGAGISKVRDELLQHYIPGKILQCSAFPVNSFPLLKDKDHEKDAMIYLCKNHACMPPVDSIKKLFLMLEKTREPA